MYKILISVVSRAGAKLYSPESVKLSCTCTGLLDLTHLVIPWPLGTDNPNQSRVQAVLKLVGFMQTGPSKQHLWKRTKILSNGTAWVGQALDRDLNIMQILITTSDLGRCGSSEQSVPSSVSIFKDESSPTLPLPPQSWPGQHRHKEWPC